MSQDAGSTEQPSAGDEAVNSVSQRDPVRFYTRAILAAVCVIFVWYVWTDRVAPWTDQARVDAFVVPITPKVSGKVVEISVTQDQVVEAGDLLARIESREYELAIQRAEAQLEIAGQASRISRVWPKSRLEDRGALSTRPARAWALQPTSSSFPKRAPTFVLPEDPAALHLFTALLVEHWWWSRRWDGFLPVRAREGWVLHCRVDGLRWQSAGQGE